MGGQPLAGRSIVVTRPAGQADGLCAALRGLGAEPLCFPLLTITPVADKAPLRAVARRLALRAPRARWAASSADYPPTHACPGTGW